MRILICIFFLNTTLVIASLAQNNFYDKRFEKVDQHVSEVSRQFIFHPQLLVEKLTENLTNDYDKVRAFYVWIATNTKYDMFAYYHNNKVGQGVNEVLGSGKALCSGFSILFKYFCDHANIEAEIIEGYAKGFDYKKGQRFKFSNHAWNAVFIHGSWYLLDVTWAAENPIIMSRNQRKVDLDTYFLVSPEKLIKTHLPEDPTWQLLENKVSLAEFEGRKLPGLDIITKNSYNPQNYLGMNEYDKDILKYKRSIHFNPKNSILKKSLCFAYLYKGISMTDELWKMDFQHLSDTADILKTDFYSTLDSAMNTIVHLKSVGIYQAKRIIEIEMNYQKGVFNYELGSEFYKKAINREVPVGQANEIIESYYEVAEEHFKNVRATSLYFNDAHEYLNFIIDFRDQKAMALSNN